MLPQGSSSFHAGYFYLRRSFQTLSLTESVQNLALRNHRDIFSLVHQRMLQADRSFPGADHHAGAAVVAFSRISHDRVFPLHR